MMAICPDCGYETLDAEEDYKGDWYQSCPQCGWIGYDYADDDETDCEDSEQEE